MLVRRYFTTWWALTLLPIALVLGSARLWARAYPDRVTGGSTAGLWFGLLGWLCMLATFVMLPWQRRREALRRPGRPRHFWLKGHLWLALLGLALVLAHAGLRLERLRLWGGLEIVLMLALALTFLTGVWGLAVQSWLPGRLIRASEAKGDEPPIDVPAGQIAQVCEVWRTTADRLIEEIVKALDAPTAEATRASYLQHVRPFLSGHFSWRQAGAALGPLPEEARKKAEKQLGELEKICALRRHLRGQQRLHWWLHSWLYLHVSLSVVMLFLGLIHALVCALY